MNLLYITNGINGSGGLERVLSVKASCLAEHYDYKVHILCLNDADKNPFYKFSNKIDFYSVEVSGNPASYFLKYKTRIQKIISQIKPDIISVCDDGLKGFFLPRMIHTDAKWVYERHVSKQIEDNENYGFLKKKIIRLKWKLMDYAGKRFDKFIVLTNGNTKEWKGFNNLMVIPNPLSFYPKENAKLENKIVICVGRIMYQKGQDLLIQIWESLSGDFPGWELHLYGKENPDFINTNQLPDNIKYFPPEKNIKSKYLESSVYAMSSRFEGFGMVLTEAMACGVPCVSFDCPYGPGDIIKDGEDGFLVDNGDLNNFEEKLKDLIQNREKRKQFGKAARENVKRYSVDEVINKWNGLFLNLAETH